jgi:hypothetical protein
MICGYLAYGSAEQRSLYPGKWRLIQIKVDADQSAPCEEQNIKDAVR